MGYSTVDRGGIMSDTRVQTRGGRLQMPRSRGAASGFLLILLGAWGALIPFIGSYFDFAFTPDTEWTWTMARGWLEVLPGVATVLGGLLLLASSNRATAMLGGWLTVLAGAWFVVGRALAGPLAIGDVGTPVAATETKRVWLELTYFYGLGALIIFFGAVALGRLSVRSVRDVAYAERPAYAGRPVAPYAQGPVAGAAQPQPAPSEEVTEIQPTRGEHHRGWRDMFGGGRRPVHR
jgi:hypothetical protein